MGDEITIRRAESVDDYRACQDAQRLAWGIVDESYVVPIATMVGAQLHGGLVLGAFLPGGGAAGFSFAFLGKVEGRLCFYSQLTGVAPGWQARGLGFLLKQAQREEALREGIDLIAWAFDPLQSGNARFNLDKLGASAGRYVDNMYGLRTDALNAGVPTDRLIAEWELSSSPRPEIVVEETIALPRLLETGERDDGQRVVTGTHFAEAPRVLLEIPDDIAGMRSRDADLAERWRNAVREGFTAAFATGYRAVGFFRERSGSGRRGFYLLEHS